MQGLSVEGSVPSTTSKSNLKNILVRAGAGAGKTTELTNRVLNIASHFWANEKKFPKLVVTTFTRKATQELKERLWLEAMKRQQPELEEYLRKTHFLHISTIHGVLGLFLNEYGSAMGLMPGFKYISEEQNFKLFKKILRESYKDQMADHLLFWQDKISMNQLIHNLLLFAEFYEFKSNTQVITKDNFVQKIQSWFNELKKLTLELSKNISLIAEKESWQNWSQHLYGVNEIQWDIHSKAATELRSWYGSWPTVRNLKNEIPDQFMKQKKYLSDQWDEFLNIGVNLDWTNTVIEHSEKYFEFANLYLDLFWSTKIKLGQITMADLETLTLKLIKDFPSTADSFSKDWDYWLIDEYQDTSPKQVYILKHLIGEQKKFIVGDPQQSIYLFRGARSKVFNQAEDEFRQDSASEFLLLNKNYRSQKSLLHFFNWFFENLGNQFQPMIAGKLDEEQQTDAYVYQSTSCSEPELALKHISELIKKGVPLEQICVLSRRNKDLEKFVNKSSELGLPIQWHSSADFFDKIEIKDALAVLKFLVNPYDNLNVLKVLRSPWFKITDLILAKILNSYSSFSKIRSDEEPLKTEQDQTPKKEFKSFWNLIQKNEYQQAGIDRLKEYFKSQNSQGTIQVWENILLESGFLDSCDFFDPSGQRLANLLKLVQMIRNEERKPGFQILSFIQQNQKTISVETDGESEAAPVVMPSRVNAMTVHASKGLQFDHVIVLGCGNYRNNVEKSFMNWNEELDILCSSEFIDEESKFYRHIILKEWDAEKQKSELEEYDRVLYVAMTRAKKTIALINATNSSPAALSWAARWPIPMNESQLLKIQDFSIQVELVEDVNLTEFSLKNNSEIINGTLNSENTVNLQLQNTIGDSDILNLKNSNLENLNQMNINRNKVAKKLISTTEIINNSYLFKNDKAPEIQKIPNSNWLLEALKKARLGTDIHKIFEDLQYSTKYITDSIELELDNSEIGSAINYAFQWENGILKQVMQNGYAEKSFSLQFNNQILQGQIDLWGKDQTNQIWIIDYKTGDVKHKDKALTQLKIYAWALRQLHRIDSTETVKIAALYPLSRQSFIEEISPNNYPEIEEIISIKQ